MSSDSSTQSGNEIQVLLNQHASNKIDNSMQTEHETPILLNQYVFNNVVNNVLNELNKNYIKCSVCLEQYDTNSFAICKSCNNIFHATCANNSKKKCPVCRYATTTSSSTIYWYNSIVEGNTLHAIILTCVNIHTNIKNIIDYKDLPRNMVPALEAQYNGITQKISETFDSIKHDLCVHKALTGSMELSNYMMLKCAEIDEAHKNIIKCETEIASKMKNIIKKELEYDRKINELKRQTEIYNGCKSYLSSVIDKLDKDVYVEQEQLRESVDVKTQIDQWETKNTIDTKMTNPFNSLK